MNASGIYDYLMRGRDPAAPQEFDAHVVACIAAVSLPGPETAALLAQFFPHATALSQAPFTAPEIQDDERSLRDLLTRYSTSRSAFEAQLAALIARRAQAPNHLWQDLGLHNRAELSRLMKTHFAPLAARNRNDMKWKKFLYRMICRDDGFRLCTAPVCSECDDFSVCFGDESGESLLARNRSARATSDLLQIRQ